MEINYKGNPFFLTDQDIAWVNETYDSMTVREKIGQLFCTMGVSSDKQYLDVLVNDIKIGGIMYRPGKAEDVWKTHKYLQDNSKIPLLLAANLEAGGSGGAIEGTNFAKPLGVASTNDAEMGYRLGKIACKEGASLGLNWSFAPIVDIDMNFRNPITNLRTFGSDADTVIKMAEGYMKGADECGLAVSIKHFPGDGVDERDQHLLTSVNSLSCEEWDKTYGKVYSTLIEKGAKTVMVGHIAQPSYQTALAKNSEEYKNKTVPATLSKELMTGLLRGKLGFNGLISTDASQMLGFTVGEKRETAVPKTIACGADVFLFVKDLQEDFKFMLDGYENGIITDERLSEAVHRILALKASLNLHNKQKAGTLVPPIENLQILGCEEHKMYGRICADKAITLVKDTQKMLPLDVKNGKRLYLNVLEPDSNMMSPLKTKLKAKFEAEGYEVHLRNRDTNVDIMGALTGESNDPHAMELLQEVFCKVNDFSNQYDLAVYVANYETASNNVVIRLQWQGLMGMGNDAPWFVAQVPTMFVSLANPYHLLDVPMIKTFINGYTANDYVIDALFEKIMGRCEFKGKSPCDVFCGREDTKY